MSTSKSCFNELSLFKFWTDFLLYSIEVWSTNLVISFRSLVIDSFRCVQVRFHTKIMKKLVSLTKCSLMTGFRCGQSPFWTGFTVWIDIHSYANRTRKRKKKDWNKIVYISPQVYYVTLGLGMLFLLSKMNKWKIHLPLLNWWSCHHL
jgi:hypothetical protein